MPHRTGSVRSAQTFMARVKKEKQRLKELKWRGDLIPASAWNIVRGDKVALIQLDPKSRYRDEVGKKGVVKEVFRSRNQVVIEGFHLRKRFHARTPERMGFKKNKESPIHYSNVQLVDPLLNIPTRIYRGFLENGEKVRVSVRTGAVIPKPKLFLKEREERRKKIKANPLVNTAEAQVTQETYEKPDFAKVAEYIQQVKDEKTAIRLAREASFAVNPKLQLKFAKLREQQKEENRGKLPYIPSELEKDKSKWPQGLLYAIRF